MERSLEEWFRGVIITVQHKSHPTYSLDRPAMSILKRRMPPLLQQPPAKHVRHCCNEPDIINELMYVASSLQAEFFFLENLTLMEKIATLVQPKFQDHCVWEFKQNATKECFCDAQKIWRTVQVQSTRKKTYPTQCIPALTNTLLCIIEIVDRCEQPGIKCHINESEMRFLTVFFSVLVFSLSFCVDRLRALGESHEWISEAFVASIWTIVHVDGWSVFASLTSQRPVKASYSTSGILVKIIQMQSHLFAVSSWRKMPCDVVQRSGLVQILKNFAIGIPSTRVIKGVNVLSRITPHIFKKQFCSTICTCFDQQLRLFENKPLDFDPQDMCVVASMLLDTFYNLSYDRNQNDTDGLEPEYIFPMIMKLALTMECTIRKFKIKAVSFSLVPAMLRLANRFPKCFCFLFLQRSLNEPKQPDSLLIEELFCDCRILVGTAMHDVFHVPVPETIHNCPDLILSTCDLVIQLTNEIQGLVQRKKTTFGVHKILVYSKCKKIEISSNNSRFMHSVAEFSDMPAWCVAFVLKFVYSGKPLKIDSRPDFETPSSNMKADFENQGTGFFWLCKDQIPFVVSIQDALSCYMAADAFGADDLCREIESQLCMCDLTIQTVEAIAVMAMNFISISRNSFKLAPMLLWRCHQFALKRPVIMSRSRIFFAALMTLEHNVRARAMFLQDVCLFGVANEFILNNYCAVVDEKFLLSLAQKVDFLL